jgi:hypothetical protein
MTCIAGDAARKQSLTDNERVKVDDGGDAKLHDGVAEG